MDKNLEQQKKIQKIIDAKIVPGKLYLNGEPLPSRVKYVKKDLLQLGTSLEESDWVRNICCMYQDEDGEWKYICDKKHNFFFVN